MTNSSDKQRFRRLEELFHQLIDLDEPARSTRLAELASSLDDDFYAELDEMLTAVQQMDERQPAVADPDQTTTLGPAAAPGSYPTRLGPYHIVKLLGEGGMGRVYEASQESPVRRRVALKLIARSIGHASEIRSRFEAERQILARMQHPNVAQILDAGEDDGQPWLAMELVDGQPIDAFCAEHDLDVAARLRLMGTVCSAVAHAHQKGIIHRDLKPSNVLVGQIDGVPIPKVIDFGVSKLLEHDPGATIALTRDRRVVGTPQYMSPEQASEDLDVDTRSDVYSLGALLYELLTGEPPIPREALESAGIAEMLRLVREHETPTPSATIRRVRTRHAVSRSPTRTGSGDLPRDLDWIVLKALDKDRERRYASPEDLRRDLERHLDHLPVLAGPPSASYRLRKFVRRHRMGSLVAALLLLAVMLGVGGLGIGLKRARQAERERAREAAVAERVSGFLASLFRENDPLRNEGREATARDILDRGLERIREDGELATNPDVRARLLDVIADTYVSLDLHAQAAEVLDETILMHRQLESGDLELARALRLRGMIEIELERPEVARPFLFEAGELLESSVPQSEWEWVAWLIDSSLLAEKGDHDLEKAVDLRKRAVELVETHHADSPFLSRTRSNLAVSYFRQAQYGEAAQILEGEIDRWRQGEVSDAQITDVLQVLSVTYRRQGRIRASRGLIREGIEIERRVFDSQPLPLSSSLNALGSSEELLGEFDASRAAYEETLDLVRAAGHEIHPRVLEATLGLARLSFKSRQLGEGRRMVALATEISCQIQSLPTFSPLRVLRTHIELELAVGDVAEARRALSIGLEPGQPDLPQSTNIDWHQHDPVGHGLLLLEAAILDARESDASSTTAASVDGTALIESATRERPLIHMRLAALHVASGDRDQALESLRAAADDGYRDAWVAVDPTWAPLRSETRFADVLDTLAPGS